MRWMNVADDYFQCWGLVWAVLKLWFCYQSFS